MSVTCKGMPLLSWTKGFKTRRREQETLTLDNWARTQYGGYANDVGIHHWVPWGTNFKYSNVIFI